LCKTREGRPTPAIRFTQSYGNSGSRANIWVQARQHAWEAGSSWVAKGLIDWLGSESAIAGRLKREAVITVIPIMDIDNVYLGAGGKNQKPQDHNRDWTDQPYWKAVAEAQRSIEAKDRSGRFALFIDLHNPGASERFLYYFVPPRESLSELGQRNLSRFVSASKDRITGPLRFTGRIAETGQSYDPKAWQAISKNWVSTHCQDHVVALTVETPWNTPSSTIEGYETVGRQLGEAIAKYLEVYENPMTQH
jgi:hypothetical protein